MSRAIRFSPKLLLIPSFALFLTTLLPENGWAQQYLGNARRRCSDVITITSQAGSMQVRPFEARSTEVQNATVSWQCGNQAQGEIQCPANTNKILIDRSQGGSFFSVVCLQR